MAYSLRLPDQMDAAARQLADRRGISINSLVCTALDEYLARWTGLQGVPADPVAPLEPAAILPPSPVAKTAPAPSDAFPDPGLEREGRALLKKQQRGYQLSSKEKATLSAFQALRKR